MKQLIYTALFGIVCAGLAYAADQRIDERVQQAIDAYDVRQITREIQQIILMEETAPELVTPRDRATRRILEQQLKQLGGQQ